MISRCYYPSHPAFKYYGGRGIQVCDRWLGKVTERKGKHWGGFDAFVMDMGVPLPGMTLDRIDNALGYSPENCRWATWKEQAANRGRTGKAPDPASLRQRALAAGLSYMLVYLRINRQGWSESEALSTPSLGRGRIREGSLRGKQKK